MKPIKIIGIGSPFGQDQVGWLVVDQISRKFDMQNGISIALSKIDRPGLQLLELLRNADTAILVDAIDDRQRAGQIIEVDKSELVVQDKPLSTHGFGVSEALSLGEVIGKLPTELKLFGLCIDPDKPTIPDSLPVRQLAATIMSTIEAELNRQNA